MKYSNLISIVIFMVLSFLVQLANATPVIVIKEYTYHASEFDTQETSRVIALEQVKRSLLEELGTYLESDTEVENFQLTKDKITTLTAGIVQTKILQEKWTKPTYWLKAKIMADNEQVVKSINALRMDRSKIKELEELKQRTDTQLQEIDRLRAELTVTKGMKKKDNLMAYNKTVKELRASDWFLKGWSLQNAGNHKDAITAYNKAIELDPSYAMAFNMRGAAYTGLGVFAQAMRDHGKAIDLDPQYAAAFNNRGVAYCQLGNFSQAIQDFNKGIDLDPEFEAIYVNRGNAYYNLGNFTQAINDFNKAIELNPNNATTYSNRGNTYRDTGNFGPALHDFNRSIELNPNVAAVYWNRGALYGQQLGNYRLGEADIKKAAQLGLGDAQELLRRNRISW